MFPVPSFILFLMAGMYFHIPFCKQACHYCDFHFSTSLKGRGALVHSLVKEMALRKDYLPENEIGTVYFGGGTPSLLENEELTLLMNSVKQHFGLNPGAEVTFEANPDDLSLKKLEQLAAAEINRLSIGIQSFRDNDLSFLNRAHNAQQAAEAVKNAFRMGFSNITIDLIYGIPTLDNDSWKRNIEMALELNVPHLSCYSLTVEPRTALADMIKKGKAVDVDPARSAEQFSILMDELSKAGFVHYEISNFCKEGFVSRHNSNYWKGEHYLGIGPSAHSYDGASRQWNVRSNAAYVSSLEKGVVPQEKELLTSSQRYNEYVLTSLRTIWGADEEFIKRNFSPVYFSYFLKAVAPALEQQLIMKAGSRLSLTKKGKFFADRIASDLFIVS